MAEESSLDEDVRAEQEQQSTEEQNREKRESKLKVPFYLLFSFADSLDYSLMLIGTVGAIGSGLSIPLMTAVFGDLLDSFGGSGDTKHILHAVSKVCLKFLYLALGSGAASFLQVACWMVTGERQAARIRSLYLKTMLRQDISYFDKETDTGEIIGRMSGDTILIQNAMGEKVGQFLQSVATFLAGFTVAFVKGWLLGLAMLSSIPPLMIAGAIMTIIVGKMTARGLSAYSSASTVVAQTIGSIRTVASFTGEKLAIAMYNASLNKAYKLGVQEGLATGSGFGVMMFFVLSTYSLAVWLGGKMILHKGYTGGNVLTILFSVLVGSTALGQASPCLSVFAAGQVAAYKMFEAINRISLIDPYDTKGQKLDELLGDIELRDVYFRYPARPDQIIFNGLSLTIPSGTNLALVGESGSGKSTVISLIERFYDPQGGEILIDGIDLREFQLKWIRQKIGLVSQEPVLFASTIRENISYGKEEPTEEEIKAATEMANAAKFIENFPQGLDTMVGEHGTQLSGGQKQRIAIARAILKDPRILLLDEATSALDAESERVVQEALDRVMMKRTTVIVAHRLSTVKNATVIAVIHRGKIIEKGSHTELTMDPDGAYSQLIRLQELKPNSEGSLIVNHDRSEITNDSGRISSQRISSFHRSTSHGSSGVGNNSSRHSFSLFGVPSGLSIPPEEDQQEALAEKSEEASDIPLRRLALLNCPEIPVLVAGSIAAAAAGMIFPLYGVLLSKSIKTFYSPPHELKTDSRFWALMFLVLAGSCLVFYPLKSYFFSVAGCKLIQRIRKMCFEKVIHMEMSWFDKAENSSGIIGSRLSSDAASLRGLVGDALGLLVQNVAGVIAGVAIAFHANWQLALIILALIPMLGVNGFFQVKLLQGFSADAKKLYNEASQVASEAVGSIRTIASFCAEDRVMEMYTQKCRGPIRTGIKGGIISGFFFGLSFFLLFAVYASSFYLAAVLLDEGKTTFSDVFLVFFTLALTAYSVAQSGSFVPDSGKAKSSATSVFAILDQESKIDASDNSGMMLENLKGEIELHHVSFRYPNRSEVQIFQDLCLLIRSGKTVALVGESGSGKSTVISLLQRFYDPNSGIITLDGTDIQKLQLKWLRQQMGLVSQEPVLFNDTIRANIAYGKEGNATEAEILSAAETANAHNFISGLQNGYDTIVGERGVQLSGGQKQRVAIARAIIKAPKILLLDEATSALDAESERVVQDALDQVMLSRTTIVVAHRLATIKGADLIAVVKNGVIAEKGKHEALMGIQDGVYASLVALHSHAPS